jgi:MSHA biogenesis protein MshO
MSRHAQLENGFTLIELITVIIILGVVSVGISGFVRTGMNIYNDVTERDQLLSGSRFVVERINRELRTAVPNSIRIKTDNTDPNNIVQCLEFVPTKWVAYYTNIPVFPDLPATTTSASVVELSASANLFPLQGNEFAIVYPTSWEDIYGPIDTTSHKENKRLVIRACTDTNANCSDSDGPPHLATLTLSRDGNADLTAFADDSPASRLYIVSTPVSYCARNKAIYRHNVTSDNTTIGLTQTVYTSGGVLMAENLANTVSAVSPFYVVNSTLNRNGLVQILLAFERGEEIVNFSNEVHITNVP